MLEMYLPLPISVNAMYGQGRGKKFISRSYAKWIQRADEWLDGQPVVKPKRPIDRPVSIEVVAYRGKGWTERVRDLDNMLKSLQDYLVRNEWLKDDNSQIVRRISIELSGEMAREACTRVRINEFMPGIAD